MFGDSGGSDGNAAKRTIVFGVAIGIAFILLLVAGIVSDNWLGMIMIVPLIMVPISMIVVEALGGGSAGSGMCSQVQEISDLCTATSRALQEPGRQLLSQTLDSVSLGFSCHAYLVFQVSQWSATFSSADSRVSGAALHCYFLCSCAVPH